MSSTADATIMMCANCGKGEESAGDLKACTACKMVKYCNRECQIAHRPQHKKSCKKRAAKLHDEKLFKEPPPREECPICILPLPIAMDEQSFKSCCGKTICGGCIHAMAMEDVKKGKKKAEEVGICAFCRTPRPSSDEEVVKRLQKLMERGNADAYYQFGGVYANGDYGLQQDRVKANELWLKAGELGCAEGYCNVGNAYDTGAGVQRNEKKATHLYELGAMLGNVNARYNLGALESEAGNHERTFKHFILAARAGHKKSLDFVKQGFIKGFVTKEEYESTLRAYHERRTEMKSDMRTASIAFLELWNGSR